MAAESGSATRMRHDGVRQCSGPSLAPATAQGFGGFPSHQGIGQDRTAEVAANLGCKKLGLVVLAPQEARPMERYRHQHRVIGQQRPGRGGEPAAHRLNKVGAVGVLKSERKPAAGAAVGQGGAAPAPRSGPAQAVVALDRPIILTG